MIDKQKINFINGRFKDHKIEIFVEQKMISYKDNTNYWLCAFFLKTNSLYGWLKNNNKNLLNEKLINRTINK